MGSVEQGVLLDAGVGGRRLPVTKSTDKGKLAIGNYPTIDYPVKEIVTKAGIKDIICVVDEGSDQLERFYTPDPEMEEYYESRGRLDYVEILRAIGYGATFKFVNQKTGKGAPYGTAYAVSLVSDHITSEQFVLSTGDDFTYNEDGSSDIARMIEIAQEVGATSAMLATEIDPAKTESYGVIETSGKEPDLRFVEIIEGPRPEEAPSNLINISKYLFDRHMLECVKEVMERPPVQTKNGPEYQLTDALNLYVASGQRLAVVKAKGEYMDCGSLAGWFKAVMRIVPTQL